MQFDFIGTVIFFLTYHVIEAFYLCLVIGSKVKKRERIVDWNLSSKRSHQVEDIFKAARQPYLVLSFFHRQII